DILGSVTTALTLFLTAVASISLIVGGIGIMNIMLVSVTERTREIGLRKAVGAHPRDILLQFLTESVFLTTAGGALGALLSLAASAIISQFQTGWTFVIPLDAVILSFSVAAVVGMLFGIYPAVRAARLNPIEALRYE
ncbi:MAG: FtsX-like permease family protein, partial [Phycisphaerae bacterium]|nr:FtsX-like permease family protein [Phycisphaerae bacterium]